MRALTLSVFSLVLSLLSAGCGSSSPAETGGGGQTGGAGGRGGTGGTGGSAGATVIIEPSLFDCTRTKDPVRVNEVPIECATDPSCSTKLVSGHRGAGGEIGIIAPEDTVAAVRAAIAIGIDFIETDPRPTKDGVLVNVHDTTVDRIAFGTGEVAQMTLAELKALELKTSEFAGDYSCERIATIEEILSAAKGKVHVLLDANKTDQVGLLVSAVQKTGTLEWAIFDTDSQDKIDQALALEPALLTMIRVVDTTELDSELSHFSAHPPIIVEIHDTPDIAPVAQAVHAAQNRALGDTFATDIAAGLGDDPSLYDEVWATGLDVLQTDRPDFVLRNLGRWPPPPQP